MYPLKLKPAFKDYIWGGNRLKTLFNMESDLDKIAEAWVLSCHKDGESIVANGEYEGLALSQAIEKMGRVCLGTNGQKFDFFPILIKLIDAKDNLSIQVHPDDEYALIVEGEYGKTEMWYIVDCEPGAFLYYGFNREIDKEEFARRIEQNTLLEVLNKVEVKKGDCFFIKAGTIHAIGKGLLVAEIQQNSNTTYRVYDYGRVGKDGKPRELHIDKALQVTELGPAKNYTSADPSTLAECEYFSVKKLNLKGALEIDVDDSSFVSLLSLGGSYTLGDLTVNAGECVFLPAGFGKATLKGNAEILLSRV
ncbi:MAG TPA: class I mannose-6-phosphate isomerase [Clostridiales bacterium]|nr:class I mannose-6-phosphate isomerase [Clostridiales bacterium]